MLLNRDIRESICDSIDMCAADSLRRVSIDKHEVETLWTYVLVNRDNKESICHSIDMCAADVSHSFLKPCTTSSTSRSPHVLEE